MTTPPGEKRETWELGRGLQDPWCEGLKGTVTTLLSRETELCDCSYVTPGMTPCPWVCWGDPMTTDSGASRL